MRPGIKAVDLVFILVHFYGYGCHRPSMRRYKLKEPEGAVSLESSRCTGHLGGGRRWGGHETPPYEYILNF